MLDFGQKWLYSCESGCIRVKVVVFGKCGCNRTKWLFSGKNGCMRAKVVVFGQKRFYLGKVVAFGKKFVFFLAKWL